MKPLRELRREDVTFTRDVEQDDTPVRGNVLASGNDSLDKSVEDETLARLRRGDVYAWCCVMIRAEWRGFVGVASLGACSCVDEADLESLIETHGLYDEALADLNRSIRATAEMLSALEE